MRVASVGLGAQAHVHGRSAGRPATHRQSSRTWALSTSLCLGRVRWSKEAGSWKSAIGQPRRQRSRSRGQSCDSRNDRTCTECRQSWSPWPSLAEGGCLCDSGRVAAVWCPLQARACCCGLVLCSRTKVAALHSLQVIMEAVVAAARAGDAERLAEWASAGGNVDAPLDAVSVVPSRPHDVCAP